MIETRTHFSAAEKREKKPFNITIFYEDFQCSRFGVKAFDTFLKDFQHEFSLDYHMWKFDLLRFPKLRRNAINDATSADMLLICAHGNSNLPPEVESTFRMWAGQKFKHPKAVLVLMDQETPSSPLRVVFKELEARYGFDLFFDCAQPFAAA